MMDFSTSLAGLEWASTTLELTAARIATLGSAPGDSVSLSSQAVAVIASRDSFTANADVLRTDDQMTKSLLNILG
jgi:hypothetical protein